jgi:GAF domain-containing protein
MQPVYTRAEAILSDLRASLAVFRTTMRLRGSDESWAVVAESLAPGADSLKGQPAYDIRDTEPYKFLLRERRVLVQPDTRTPPVAHQLARDKYAVGAEMLAPLLAASELVGIVSVHHAREPREWTGAEVECLETAARELLMSAGLQPPEAE